MWIKGKKYNCKHLCSFILLKTRNVFSNVKRFVRVCMCVYVCVNVADFVSQILTNRSEPILDIDVSQVWTAQYRVRTVQYRTVKKSRVYSVQ